MKDEIKALAEKYENGTEIEKWVCSILYVICAVLCLGVEEVRTLASYNRDFAERMLKDFRGI